jgi:hypothetical protein
MGGVIYEGERQNYCSCRDIVVIIIDYNNPGQPVSDGDYGERGI